MLELPLALVLIHPLSLLESQWVSNYGNAQVIFEQYKIATQRKSDYVELVEYWAPKNGFPNWFIQFNADANKIIEIWSLVDDVVRLQMSFETRIKKHERLRELLGNAYWSGALPDTFPVGYPWQAPIPPKFEDDN